MITYRSFMNPGVSEAESIGRLFYDRDEQAHSSTKYLELTQAEDYILFRIVHESAEQRYGYDQYRKIFESRVAVMDGHKIADFMRTEVGTDGPYPSAEFESEYDDNLIITLTEQGATFGGIFAGDRIIKIRLDVEDAATVRMMLRDMEDAYAEMLARQVPVTASVGDFRRAAMKLDNYLSHIIYEEINYRGYEDGTVITIMLPDEYEAEQVQSAFNYEYGATVAQWWAYLRELEAAREDDLCEIIVRELGFSAGEMPYGNTFQHMHWIEYPGEYYEALTTAAHKAAMALR